MGKILGKMLALSLLGSALVGAGVAHANMPSFVGQTYAKASEGLSRMHVASEVATTIGTELPRQDCIVVNQLFRPASRFGSVNVPAKLLLSLDCNAAVASATEAGNSAGSPEGRKAKLEKLVEEWRQNTPQGHDWCAQNQRAHPNWDWTEIKGCS